MEDKPNLWVWVDEYADEGQLYTLDDNVYLSLHHGGAEAGHLLDFGTAQAAAFHLAVAPAQPEPQPGEFWYVELVGSGGQRTICYIVKEDEFMCPALGRTVNPLDVVFVGRVPPARKGETQ